MSHPLSDHGVSEGDLKFIGMAAIAEEYLFQMNIVLLCLCPCYSVIPKCNILK